VTLNEASEMMRAAPWREAGFRYADVLAGLESMSRSLRTLTAGTEELAGRLRALAEMVNPWRLNPWAHRVLALVLAVLAIWTAAS